ncbi:1-pyrroline-5-carboxylate dehydrogenase [Clostridia bacterium]|nr:1-pyrroline-5-carboxylate dehydrogenase [Clostridia bacterium]
MILRNTKQCSTIIRDFGNIVIAGHIDPDGDAIASCTALSLYILESAKNAPTILLEDVKERYKIIGADRFLKDAYEGTPDLFIAVDCGDFSRLSAYAQELFKKARKTLLIDHHISNPLFADYNYVLPDASSTSEIIFEIINAEMPVTNKEIAAALYAGIVFDTGGFRHSSTSSRTHYITSLLIGCGIDLTGIYDEIMNVHTIKEAAARSLVIEKSKLDRGIMISVVTLEDMAKKGVNSCDFEGSVNYLLATRGANAAVFIYEKKPTEFKVSMRSKKIDVSAVAQLFGGGGHKHAAACVMKSDPRETDVLVKTVCGELIERLSKCQ